MADDEKQHEQQRAFGERMRQARGKRTKQAIANEVGVNVRQVYQWELARAVPLGNQIAPIARALGVSTDWLLTGAERVSEVAP